MPDENLPQWKRKLFQQGMAVGWAEGWAKGWAKGWVIGLTKGRNLARFGARAICRAKARAICMAKGRTGGKAEEESERLREAVKTKLEELFGDLPEEAQSAVDQTTDIEILYTVLFLAGQPKTLPQYMEQLASGRTAAANQ